VAEVAAGEVGCSLEPTVVDGRPTSDASLALLDMTLDGCRRQHEDPLRGLGLYQFDVEVTGAGLRSRGRYPRLQYLRGRNPVFGIDAEAGLLEVADIVVVNKADRPGADRAAAQLRAMLTVGAASDKEALTAGRPRPKRPEVMLCSALNGKGVPELLAALDRRAPSPGSRLADDASFKRAEAQISGILAQRVNAQLHDPTRATAREATLKAVAAHELDPFTAADQLLELLREPGAG
jgi:hypothetical protein